MAEPGRGDRKRRLARLLEAGLFASRWLLAPIYVGLVVTLALLAAAFVEDLVSHLGDALASPSYAIMLALSLIDLSLAANLVLIVTLSGYENFVARIDTGRVERPVWLGTIDFSGMKMKLIASVVAISAIALLRTFMEVASATVAENRELNVADEERLGWQIVLHLVLVLSGVLFALMDWLAARSHPGASAPAAHDAQDPGV